jgi:predicted permease
MGASGSGDAKRVLVLTVFGIACTSLAKALVVVAAGALLTRRGVLTVEVRRGLSKMSASLLVPCLLMERLSRTITPSLLAEAWPIIPFGIVYVILGSLLGAAITARAALPDHLKRTMIAATAFANSQALPIILIDVIGPELFGPEVAARGVTYIGLYLTVYLVLQWSVGAALLDVPILRLGGGEATQRHVTGSEGHANGIGLQHVGLAGESVGRGPAAASTALPPESAEVGANQTLPRAAHAGTAGLLVSEATNGRGSCWRATLAVMQRVASPPIYGIIAGLCIGLLPWMRALLVGERTAVACGAETDAPQAPLRFLMQASQLMGDAAIPVNTMLLGASLSKGPAWREVPLRLTVAVVLCKLALMPAAALVLAALLTSVVQLPPLLVLVILMESAMPTANNLMMMTELAGGRASKMMSTLIAAQYLATPVLLTASLTAFMTFCTQYTV